MILQHFHKSIQGWFDFDDIYKNMVNNAQDGNHFVEIGAWLGCSTAFMAVEIANSGKKIKFDVIDTWIGSTDEVEQASYQSTLDKYNGDLYEVFIKNITKGGVRDYINPIKATSLEACKNYADESLDFVFLDANHSYESVKEDVLAWLPKVKKGGLFAGHDYIHWAGVKKLVDEIFGENIKLSKSSWLFFKN